MRRLGAGAQVPARGSRSDRPRSGHRRVAGVSALPRGTGLAGAAQEWRCPACRRSFPVRDGIVHFIESQELGPLDRRFAHLYDWFSWIYPAFTRSGFAMIGMSEGHGRRQVLDRLDPHGGRVLEVSIGPGRTCRTCWPGATSARSTAWTSRSASCDDASPDPPPGMGRPPVPGKRRGPPFQDATFDAVLHIGGINFFDDKARALGEMARVAKPGTRVVVVDENERAARGYERTLPGFRATFRQGRPPVSAP